MTFQDDPPPWSFEVCPGCFGYVPLESHDLSCPCMEDVVRVAVAWICWRCDVVLGLVGLFTSAAEARAALRRELDYRAEVFDASMGNVITLRCQSGTK